MSVCVQEGERDRVNSVCDGTHSFALQKHDKSMPVHNIKCCSSHSTDFWRPAPLAGRAPSWSDHRAGSSPTLQTSWSTTQARRRGAWCRGHRWSSWRWGRKGIKGSGYGKSKWKEGGKERKQRGQTCYCLSEWTKELSVHRASLSELKPWETLGYVCCLCNKLTHRTSLSLAMYSVFVCIFFCMGAFVHWEGMDFPWNVGHAGKHVSAGSQALTHGQKGNLFSIGNAEYWAV